MKRKSLLLTCIIAITVLILEISRIIIFTFTSEAIFLLYISSSILISLAAITIRMFIIDSQKFMSVINETDIHGSNKKSSVKILKPIRYLNLMPIAMIICSLADYTMTIDFIFGMLIFLVAQILYILAFSGIIHLGLKTLFSKETRVLNLSSIIIMTIIIIILYVTTIYSPEDITTLLVVPYIILLAIMALITYFGLGYKTRSLKFRLMLCGGGTFFVITDAFMAISTFYTPIYAGALWIGGTYLIAVFMLQVAILFVYTDNNI